ncbi:hypothetical protein FJZ39_01345 [Candidatus Saccharibacteria bacterium]|nr:hypothetical protein [Candidatus Saccharibacteria bacterium]
MEYCETVKVDSYSQDLKELFTLAKSFMPLGVKKRVWEASSCRVGDVDYEVTVTRSTPWWRQLVGFEEFTLEWVATTNRDGFKSVKSFRIIFSRPGVSESYYSVHLRVYRDGELFEDRRSEPGAPRVTGLGRVLDNCKTIFPSEPALST